MELNMSAISALLTTAAISLVAVGATAMPAAAESVQKTVVLVHGAFADGSSWSKVIPLLEAKGLNVVAVQNPLSSLAADVDATKRIIDQQKGPVILVGHSWGGVVITEAGTDDKVKALVYVAAFAPPPGKSVNDLSAGQPPLPWLAYVVPDNAGYLRLSNAGVHKYFAQDLPARDAAIVAATQGPTAASVFDEKVANPAYVSRPSWYVVAKSDGMIPPAAEAAMAAGIKAHVTEVDGSHVVMLSHPEAVAKVILSAAASVN
jgi:pimeloyl-ACP methyl ester carboxylesterase